MHRRFGKTVGCINELLTRALATPKPKGRYSYLAPYYSQAKSIAWDYLKDYGKDIIVSISEADLAVQLFNGSRIRLFGADNPDSLRGLYLDGTVLDEYADMRPSLWGAVIRPMLADRKGWAVFIGTPKGHNAFYDIHKLAKNSPDWFSLVCKASESGILPPEELADAAKLMTEDQYAQEFECSFEAAITGAVYGKWLSKLEAEGRAREGIYDPSLPVYTAWDLGFSDPTAIIWWQVLHDEVRIIDYYENSIEDIPHYAEIIRKKPYNYAKHFVPHDARHKLLQAGGRSIIEQFYQLGIMVVAVNATSQQNGINAARQTLKQTWIDPVKCEQLCECLKQYQFRWDEDKKDFNPKPKHDWASHGCDAFEIIAQVWRNPDQDKEEKKPRFLHDITANELFWPKDQPNIYDERI